MFALSGEISVVRRRSRQLAQPMIMDEAAMSIIAKFGVGSGDNKGSWELSQIEFSCNYWLREYHWWKLTFCLHVPLNGAASGATPQQFITSLFPPLFFLSNFVSCLESCPIQTLAVFTVFSNADPSDRLPFFQGLDSTFINQHQSVSSSLSSEHKQG